MTKSSRGRRSTTCGIPPDPRRPCKTCIQESKRERYATKDGGRVSHAQVLREKYRITPADYEAMLADQRGVCAQPETALGRGGAPRRPAVDRDHRTSAVRQLLCHRCNLITGAVEDSPEQLDAVRAYLLRHAHSWPHWPSSASAPTGFMSTKA